MEADNIIILWVLLWFMQVCKEWLCMFAVAFCEEAVDWNRGQGHHQRIQPVAFCEEAVDWNFFMSSMSSSPGGSLSARKLWIEISRRWRYAVGVGVAFCEEAVDWNFCSSIMDSIDSAVAFCEEAVDWNYLHMITTTIFIVAFCEEAVDWNCRIFQ